MFFHFTDRNSGGAPIHGRAAMVAVCAAIVFIAAAACAMRISDGRTWGPFR